MRSAKGTGRLLGILLVVQLSGLIVPFILLHPFTLGPSDWLVNAGASSFQIRLAVALLFANTALTIGIAITGWRIFRHHSEAWALWLIAVSVAMFTLQAVDNAHMLAMLSLSQRFAESGGPAETYQLMAAALGSARRWVHYSELLVIDVWIFSLYSLLFRFALVPRALAAFGLVTVVLHFAGIPLQGFMGYPIVTMMGVPMAFGHLGVAGWLIARGFEEPRGGSA